MAKSNLQSLIDPLETVARELEAAGKTDAKKAVVMLTLLAFSREPKCRELFKIVNSWIADNVDIRIIDQWPELIE